MDRRTFLKAVVAVPLAAVCARQRVTKPMPGTWAALERSEVSWWRSQDIVGTYGTVTFRRWPAHLTGA